MLLGGRGSDVGEAGDEGSVEGLGGGDWEMDGVTVAPGTTEGEGVCVCVCVCEGGDTKP